MAVASESERTFGKNLLFFNIIGLWPGKNSFKFYKFVNIFFVITAILCYSAIHTFNLIFTPRKIEPFIEQLLMFFTQFYTNFQFLAIFLGQDQILKLFGILDFNIQATESFNKIMKQHSANYQKLWKLYFSLCHCAFTFLTMVPLFAHVILKHKMNLIMQWFFLSEDTKSTYILYLFAMEFFFVYYNMSLTINTNSLIWGLIYMGIAQFKSLNSELSNIRLSAVYKTRNKEEQIKQINSLKQCAKQHDLILRYCEMLQNIFSLSLFFQYAVGSISICVNIYTFTLPTIPNGRKCFIVLYNLIIVIQLYLPCLLGTWLTTEGELTAAAIYESDWIESHPSYKSNMKVLVDRANKPMVLTICKMFTMSLTTFSAIMKTAYSFLALLRNVQES